MKVNENGCNMLKILVYVIFSAGGLILLKIGTSREFLIEISRGVLHVKLNIVLLSGMVLYVISFITSLIVMKSMNLSIFYPVSAGLVYIVVCFASYFILKEKMGIKELIGMVLILTGIVVMNIGKE